MQCRIIHEHERHITTATVIRQGCMVKFMVLIVYDKILKEI